MGYTTYAKQLVSHEDYQASAVEQEIERYQSSQWLGLIDLSVYWGFSPGELATIFPVSPATKYRVLQAHDEFIVEEVRDDEAHEK